MAHGQQKFRRPTSEKDPKRDVNSAWEHDLFEQHEEIIKVGEQLRKRENQRPASINVSNLHCNVTEEDLYDLFSLVGNLKKVCLNCDKNGRSLGTAKIFFERNLDAKEAMYRYKGCRLDGQILKIEIETSMPIYHKNFQKNEAAHMDVAGVVDCFKFLKLE